MDVTDSLLTAFVISFCKCPLVVLASQAYGEWQVAITFCPQNPSVNVDIRGSNSLSEL